MALPAGVTTATVTAGVPVSHTGAPVKAFLSIEPSVFLVHTATGTPLVDFLEELDISEGVAGQFTLPHTDQPGFQDENGNAYTNWYYTARLSYSTPSKAKTKAPKIKVFQLPAGQTIVDLDALPGGAPALPYTAPIATVTSVNGRTGPVTIEDGDLPERLSEAELSATYAGKSVEADVAPLKATAVAKAATGRILYQPTSEAMLRWRLLRAEVLNGQKQGHIAFLGDSIAFGTGNTANKYEKSHPGQVRKILDTRNGAAGTGIVPGNNALIAAPSLDNRFTFGPGVTAQAWGLHEYGMFNITAGTTNYFEFTAVADEFYVYCIGSPTLSVDGGAAVTQVSGNKLPGYTSNHLVYKVTTGSTASHTLRVAGNPGGNMQVFGVEGRITGNGRWRVSNQGIDGRSLNSLFLNNTSGETSGLRGLPFIDSLKADLLVIALGTNDWQGQRTIAATKDLLTQVVQRQRSKGTNALAGPHAGGEAVLLWNPHPDTRDAPTGLQPVGGPAWELYRDMYYQVAQEQNCGLIDLGELWGMDFNKVFGSTYGGLFNDRVHPNDRGNGDMAGAVNRALFIEA